MPDIAGSAVAGLIAALTATTILGAAKWIHLKYLQRLDVKQIREVLTTGRKRVMDATLPGDVLRAAQYNLIIKQLRVALDHTTSKLPYAKRKDIFDALDWYHVKFLYATKNERDNPVFRDLPDGSWPTTEMQESQAVDKFKGNVQSEWGEEDPQGAGRFFAPHGVALDSRGDLYVGEVAFSYSHRQAPPDAKVLRKYARV